MAGNSNHSTATHMTDRHRVFVSYSHKDADDVRVIVKYLEAECDVEVIWDQTFAYGRGFHEQIRDFIAHSHVFLPVITPSSKERGWVHQEIGYAMAMNIPVLPITIDATPEQMISFVHAVKLEPPSGMKTETPKDSPSEEPGNARPEPEETWIWSQLKNTLSKKKLDFLVERNSDTSLARYQCGDYQEERTMLMVRHANVAYDILFRGHLIRQLGGLSSFHIPSAEPTSEIWDHRYGKRERSEFHRKLQRTERESLELHANEAGGLLIINPYHIYQDSGPRAYAVRLLCFYQFLKRWNHGMLVVAISHRLGFHESLTIVGDVFAAVAVAGSSRGGYMQSVFTTHAPSMKARHVYFDGRLVECLKEWSRAEQWELPVPDPSSHFIRALKDSPEFCKQTVNSAAAEIERILREYLHVKADPEMNPVNLTEGLAKATYQSPPYDSLVAKPPKPVFVQ